MSVGHHDHPESPDTVLPENLDLYALDALPEQESESVEQALVSATPEQRTSMLAHIRSTRELAAELVAVADLDVRPPAALRARVLDLVAAAEPRGSGATGTPADARPGDDLSGGGGTVVDLSAARDRRRPGMMTFLAAAAAIALLAAGVTIGRLTDGGAAEENLPVAAPPAATMPEQVSSLLAAEDLEVARGRIGGTGNATVLASQAADMAVISMTGIPEPANGRAYQLWLMGPDHDPIPAGTMESGQVGPAPSAQLSGIRASTQIGITEEPAGGSPAPTGEVLLAIDLT
ncbi:anti-sigma factor [Rhodococcus sp. IEGM 1408]|uniref:anti-sigma factor n=1 Tax=Rhodococcus sp. IEGM 1408 TaxID=3082220 RepID=UPI002955203C|nr:anti-sigma factor [Rhodococcus sp. IEGM 1408]MDV7999790.1 anti-sigma factor [Rhodococcus sp. IEGM 1408]